MDTSKKRLGCRPFPLAHCSVQSFVPSSSFSVAAAAAPWHPSSAARLWQCTLYQIAVDAAAADRGFLNGTVSSRRDRQTKTLATNMTMGRGRLKYRTSLSYSSPPFSLISFQVYSPPLFRFVPDLPIQDGSRLRHLPGMGQQRC